MGMVYVAYDPELDRRIAIKLLLPGPGGGAGERARLLREGRAMARLSHPNVVAVYDVGTCDERVFVAMELVQGRTLSAWLETRARSTREIVQAFVPAARGLSAAHAAGMVHRDFKPDNVLVGDDGRVRITDFGLARTQAVAAGHPGDTAGDVAIDACSGESAAPPSGEWFPMFGSLVGTPRYVPPEQLGGEAVDARADQFAFAAALWEALCGQPPFEGDDLITLLANVYEGRLREPRAGGLPGSLRAALTRALSAERHDRFSSMKDLIDALEADPGSDRWASRAA